MEREEIEKAAMQNTLRFIIKDKKILALYKEAFFQGAMYVLKNISSLKL